MEDRCKIEVVELHQFFQDWFNGKLEPTDKNFARFTDILGEDFTIIGPSGRVIERAPLVARVRNAHGTRANSQMWIENFCLRSGEGNLAIATYEEWQKDGDGATNTRISTVIFREKTDAPNGVEWLHVQETWLVK